MDDQIVEKHYRTCQLRRSLRWWVHSNVHDLSSNADSFTKNIYTDLCKNPNTHKFETKNQNTL